MPSDDVHTSSITLVAPRAAGAVDGEEVTFVWEPVDEAEKYRLQIAPTVRFGSPVLDEDVGSEAAITVGHQLPSDGQTFFWRVLVYAEGQWSETDSVESFVATTEEEADLLSETAPVREPVTGLARADRTEVKQETVAQEDRLQKERERGVADEGVATRQIIVITGVILVVIGIAVGVLFGWFGQVRQNARAQAADQQVYPELRQTELEATQQLQQYGVVNAEEGIYSIPIDRAMELIATEEYQQRQAE